MSVVPEAIRRNWRLKLAAFGLALFFWVVVRAEPDGASTQTVTDVPVLVQVADLDWTTAGPPVPSEVDVRIARAFGGFGAGHLPLRVRVPIDRVTSEDTVVELRRDWVVAPAEGVVQTQAISPTRVRITFERTKQTAVPLSLRTEGSLPDGVALAQPLAVNPAVVTVWGRRSRVDQVDSIPLEPIDLSELDESASIRVPLDTAGFGDLSYRTTEATLDVRLEEEVERVFPAVRVEADTLPDGVDSLDVAIVPSTVQLTLVGGRTRVSRLSAEELRAVIPYEVVARLQPGEELVAPLRVVGVPPLVEALLSTETVRVSRPGGDGATEPPDAGEEGGPEGAGAGSGTGGGA